MANKLIHTHKGTVYTQQNGVLIPVNTDGLVSYWPMTEGSGLTLYDESKNGNNGTLNNGPVWTDTANGQALSFDGVDDYVDMGDQSNLDVTEVTILAWIKADNYITDVSTVFLAGKTWYNVYTSYNLYIGGNNLICYIGNGTSQQNPHIHLIETGWHYIGFSYNATSEELRSYYDGNMVNSNTYSGFGQLATNSNPFRIGQSPTGGRYLQGLEDEVRVYNRPLSDAEVSNIYEKTRGLYGV